MYDMVIIGAGISGLYLGYKLLLQYPKKKIIIIEKNNYIGGKIQTKHFKDYVYEAGAGRISSKYFLLMKLIE